MRFRFIPFLILMSTSMSTFAQDVVTQKPSGLGLNFFFNDFQSATAIRANPLGSAIRDKKLARIKDMNSGLAISFVKHINPKVDLAATLGGAFVDYYPTTTGAFQGSDGFLLEGDASLRVKMLPDTYWVSPYLSAGVGVSRYQVYYGAILPVGAGIQLNLFKDAYFTISSQYRLKITDNTNYHFVHSIGFIGDLPKAK